MEPQSALDYRWSLPPSPYADRCGAIWLPEDERDWLMPQHPTIGGVLAIGAPTAADNRQFVRGIYDQGNEGSCVSFSDCSAVGTEGVISGVEWRVFDGHLFYRELGGTGQNGVDTRQSLQRAVDLGIPLANSSARVRIGSYFFAPRDSAQAFIANCEAAVTANKCVVVALLLPQPFGWESGDSPTSGYHQMNMVGYDEMWWIFANSWGPSFGQNGFVRVKKNYITASNLQNGYAYAATVEFLSMPPPPPPPPPVVRTVSGPTQGTAQGAGAAGLAVGQQIAVSGGPFTGTLTIAQITDGDPIPIPPPGDVKVNVLAGPRRSYVAANVQDNSGAYLTASCTLVLNGRDMGVRETKVQGATATAAVWPSGGSPQNSQAVVTAITADGRKGSGSLTF